MFTYQTLGTSFFFLDGNWKTSIFTRISVPSSHLTRKVLEKAGSTWNRSLWFHDITTPRPAIISSPAVAMSVQSWTARIFPKDYFSQQAVTKTITSFLLTSLKGRWRCWRWSDDSWSLEIKIRSHRDRPWNIEVWHVWNLQSSIMLHCILSSLEEANLVSSYLYPSGNTIF